MKKILQFRPLAYIFLLLTFALLPLSLFQDMSFCFYRNTMGILCGGCGVTRGFCAFMHFDFELAAAYNPVFTYAIFPISIFLMLEDTAVIIIRSIRGKKISSLLEVGAAEIKRFLVRK